MVKGVEVMSHWTGLDVYLPDGRSVAFTLDEFSRHCLLQGVDQLGFLLSQTEATASYETKQGK